MSAEMWQKHGKIQKTSIMRKRFEQEFTVDQIQICDLQINPKSKNVLDQLVAALKEIYCNQEYNERIFCILEELMDGKDSKNGRPGMDLWIVFVLAQVRLCLNYDYCMLHHQSNNDRLLRCLLGIEFEYGFGRRIEFQYQQIYDNVSRLNDDMLKRINDVIVEFGHKEVFKKKEKTALRLKTDSFVVESNVHFPTDYNLLWDCLRKTCDIIGYFDSTYSPGGWRKLSDWRYRLKSSMRSVGGVSSGGGKKKSERLCSTVENYISSARLLLRKTENAMPSFPLSCEKDLVMMLFLEQFIALAYKQIDLLERRVLKGETILHEEKLFSVFETYTEWITKGKLHPNVELGKKVSVTTDQYNLILHHKVMEHEQDRDIVVETADELLSKYPQIYSWSFDKGYWNKDNRELLRLEIPHVVMPKLGKLNKEDGEVEKNSFFRKMKNRHSAVESNINELENRGLDRCPDRGFSRFKTYVALSVCAYNLKKTGKKILENQCEELLQQKAKAVA
jgi:hypothetical protein